MLTERLIGGFVAAFGAVLLLVLIPMEVSDMRGPVNPALFPKAAAWLILLLGVVQILATARTSQDASPMELVRLVILAALVLGGILIMPVIGFLPTAVLMMAAVAAMMFERRLGWIAVTVIAVPAVTFTLFDIVLERPLPPMPY